METVHLRYPVNHDYALQTRRFEYTSPKVAPWSAAIMCLLALAIGVMIGGAL